MPSPSWSLIVTALFGVVLLSSVSSAEADWWDDFVNAIHSKIVSGADFIRDEAGPTIREKFVQAKETLQDPETHEKVQTWVKEEALPVIEEKWGQVKTFFHENVVPEVKKVVDAAATASERVREKSASPEEH